MNATSYLIYSFAGHQWLMPEILATWVRIVVRGQTAQAKKFVRPPSQPVAKHSRPHLSIQAIQEAEILRIKVSGQLGQKNP
jgi:hypothetical protein